MVKPLHITSTLLLGLSVDVVVAQQDPLYSMVEWNSMTVNPGATGSKDMLSIAAVTRHEFTGDGAQPMTNGLMVQSALRSPAWGVGFSLIDDRIGTGRTSSINVHLAYRIKINRRSRLAIGLDADLIGMHVPTSDAHDAHATGHEEQTSSASSSERVEGNFGFGLYYWTAKGYLGASVPKIKKDHYVADVGHGSVNLVEEDVQYYLMGGYEFILTRPIGFKPTFLLKVLDGEPLSAHFTANVLYKHRLEVGVGYGTAMHMGTNLVYRVFGHCHAGYGYAFSLDPSHKGQPGSHELMLSYDLSLKKRLLRSPRYF
jgi:type IX secretion system PorP/SprF family membrane protein